jgi:predicted transcriptional regulator
MDTEAMTHTTLKVSTHTRDRVKHLAGSRHQTADDVVTAALDALEDQQYYVSYAAAHASRTSTEIEEDAADIAMWDAASGDGLGVAQR